MIIYSDPRTLQQIYQESWAEPVPRKVNRRRYYLVSERTKTTIAEDDFVCVRHAVSKWKPTEGQMIFCEEDGDLQLVYRR